MSSGRERAKPAFLCLLVLLNYSMVIKLVLAWGFPDSAVGKESACNPGDPDSIPGSGRSPGKGIGYPVHYSGLENFSLCV